MYKKMFIFVSNLWENFLGLTTANVIFERFHDMNQGKEGGGGGCGGGGRGGGGGVG